MFEGPRPDCPVALPHLKEMSLSFMSSPSVTNILSLLLLPRIKRSATSSRAQSTAGCAPYSPRTAAWFAALSNFRVIEVSAPSGRKFWCSTKSTSTRTPAQTNPLPSRALSSKLCQAISELPIANVAAVLNLSTVETFSTEDLGQPPRQHGQSVQAVAGMMHRPASYGGKLWVGRRRREEVV
ncbi:hypothetical protein POSPLADRAFT_1134890 [Postia placenta MAD-698-R-SB12]|uniref:Uncharacterized protein n=1 Tax=Postia placenta MAD-698-R-SB12 TaxID=670580 RepID=A0A1X6N9R8_9APHY|nr:hypothetical protein POSPLADRAFT_1134890 [Postia placenta MAD-698-R-SB12]OSX65252.1 hypothetical protein POSPLADRAFT_1134890 [Postia placenta MAD-698-R-SB12]